MDYVTVIKMLLLLALVGVSAYTDLKDRRIPNSITVPFAIAGLVVNTAFDFPGGIKTGLLGFGFGFLVFLLPFIMGAMGGGDVKLMAAIGAITNMNAMIYITVITTLVGGVLIIIVRLKQRMMWDTFKRMGRLILFYFYSLIYMFVKHPHILMLREDNRLDMTDDRIDFIPYGVAIAGGTIITIGLSILEMVPQLYL